MGERIKYKPQVKLAENSVLKKQAVKNMSEYLLLLIKDHRDPQEAPELLIEFGYDDLKGFLGQATILLLQLRKQNPDEYRFLVELAKEILTVEKY